MNDPTDTTTDNTPASPLNLTLNVKRIRTHVRGGDSGNGQNSAASRRVSSLPPRPRVEKINIAQYGGGGGY